VEIALETLRAIMARQTRNTPATIAPPTTNQNIDRNIDRGNPRLDQYRGRDNNASHGRPAWGRRAWRDAPACNTLRWPQ